MTIQVARKAVHGSIMFNFLIWLEAYLRPKKIKEVTLS